MKKGFILPLILIILAVAAFYWFKHKSADITPSETSISTTTAKVSTSTTTSTASSTTAVDKNPLLTPTQEQALEKFGIDPGTLPKTLTPTMISCAKEKLGETRANELIHGATPSIADFYKARNCF